MSRKIIGVTVGTPISTRKIDDELKPVKSVNGKTPDGNGNVDTGGDVYDFAKKELFDKADLQDPGGRNSFITIDGVEYYRYHASSQNFIWENPHPKAGSVTITARLVSQYAPETVDTSRLIVHYSDGTTEYFFPMKAEPQTHVTNAAKTFVKLTGNYDMENWVLLDLSVMSAVAEYSKDLPQAGADFIGGIKADPADETYTQPVCIGADGKLYTKPGAVITQSGAVLSIR